MSAPGSEPPSMEGNVTARDEEGAPPNVPVSAPPACIPSPAPPVPATAKPNFAIEAVTEGKAVSVSSNACCSAASSPAEASPAKPAETTTSVDAAQTSTPTSRMASASDSLVCTGTSLVHTPAPPPPPSLLPSPDFGGPDSEKDYPRVLTFRGVSVTLENHNVWKKFHGNDTEMILTKLGRRMFPYCRYRLSGLDPEQKYSLVLSVVPWDQYRYRWNKNRWEASGPAEHQFQGLIRMFPHDDSPCPGSKWMSNLVSFYKLKLTNNSQDRDGHIILTSMHRYIPRLHVISFPDGNGPAAGQPVSLGPESMTFTFPQTRFMAVTTYQNLRITQLKIYFNPFARGFRDDGNNPRLVRVGREPEAVKKTDSVQAPAEKPDELMTDEETPMDLSVKSGEGSPSNLQETRLVPIMSHPAGRDKPYTPCMRGRCALGALVLVEKSPPPEQKEGAAAAGAKPEQRRDSVASTSPKATSRTPASTPETSPGSRKRRKRINRRWANFQLRGHKASPAAAHNSPAAASMQPETDDVEGLLFVSFTSKEALEVHVKDRPAASAPAGNPGSPAAASPSKEAAEAKPETDGDKIARLEPVLLNDLRVLRHRQVIHPVLQEVGLKLSSLDPAKSIDLQYLGVPLPLPPPNASEESLPAHKRLPFISRTGKTSDVTKIKGWKSKFMTSSDASASNCEEFQRNLSAFCSNMLDEYLESEARQITERADAFSTNPEGPVAYQLPAKSASYVKTLDSALKHRAAAAKSPAKANRPCPLSHKPLLYSALTAPPPSLGAPANGGVEKAARSKPEGDAPGGGPAPASPSAVGACLQRSSSSSPAISGKPSSSSTLTQRTPVLLSGPALIRHKLLVMEAEAASQGLGRTHITPERRAAALSVLVTRESKPGRLSRVPLKDLSVGSKCVKLHCRLGCVCPGPDGAGRAPAHCRKPECMLDCSCGPSEPAAQRGSGPRHRPVSSAAAAEHGVRTRLDSRTQPLWNHSRQDEDPEPLFIPKTSTDIQECGNVPPQTRRVQEQEKDPVYRYLESFMTCARVREFSPKSPRRVDPQPQMDPFCEPNPSSISQTKNATDPQAAGGDGTRPAAAKQGVKASQRNSFNGKDPKTQIQIQSLCRWQKDREAVLEALCSRMSQNRLSQRFAVGPYFINPIDRLRVQMPSGSIVTYRLQIGLRSNGSDDDGDEADYEVESAVSEEDDEDDHVDEPKRFLGVTPFLSGVLPFGKMKVRRKSPMSQQGLVQVNGKCYNHVKLMLGRVGALHPANRLAAFVTGRLKGLKASQRISQKPDSQRQPTASSGLRCQGAGSGWSPPAPEPRPSDMKAQAQPQEPDVSPDEPATSGQGSEVQSLVSSRRHPAGPLQGDATSSPIVLTACPSLLSPRFLEESGTCSFRICPSSSQSTQTLPGVPLPGGFTLIQLPKHGAEVAAQQPAPPNGADRAGVSETPPPSNRFSQFASAWLSAKTQDKIRSMLSGESVPGASAAPLPPEGGDTGEDPASAESPSSCDSSGVTSDSSDYSDCEDSILLNVSQEELVDVETVEETQLKEIDEMKQIAVRNREPAGPKVMVEVKRRRNHTAVERARRLEQSELFSKLSRVLRSNPRTARLTLLERAVDEIRNLTRVSHLLESKKRTLAERQHDCLQKLSSLSGKSPVQIKNKLTEIYARQTLDKTSNGRFFSSLLRSRAAHLETQALQSSSKPPPPDVAPVTPARNNTHRRLFVLRPHLYKTLTDSSGGSTVAGPIEPGEVVDPSPVGERHAKLDDAPEPSGATPGHETAADTLKQLRSQPDDAPAQSSACSVKRKSGQQASPMPFNLPLIRSKTGRIILPSCLKPLGNGYYTLVGMKSKEGGANQLTGQEDTQTVSHLYVEGQGSSASEDKPPSLDWDVKPSAPFEPALLDQKPPAPSADPDARPKGEASLTDADGREIIASTFLTFNPLPGNATIPPECSVGRPPKRAAGTTAGRSPQPKRPNKAEKNVAAGGDAAETPVSAKRRGRPRKGGSGVKRGVGRPPKPKGDDPGSSLHRFRSRPARGGGPGASRPLTRGALGKDFPSAKKRSWIDIEKELESDEESE